MITVEIIPLTPFSEPYRLPPSPHSPLPVALPCRPTTISNAGLCKSRQPFRSEEHTSELQSLMRISYAVFCLKKKKNNKHKPTILLTQQEPPNHNIITQQNIH